MVLYRCFSSLPTPSLVDPSLLWFQQAENVRPRVVRPRLDVRPLPWRSRLEKRLEKLAALFGTAIFPEVFLRLEGRRLPNQAFFLDLAERFSFDS